MKKSVKAWYVEDRTGHRFLWTKSGRRAEAINAFMEFNKDYFPTWRRARYVGYTCRRVVVKEE